MSNWGKAHINNSNGFGQAGINNDNGYGSVYDVSSSGDTILNPDLAPDYFAMTIDSTKAGTPSDQFQFTGAVGEYDVDAVQNDVVVQSYTGLVDEQTITLPSAGIYQVRVKPVGTNPFNQIKFDDGGDKDKVLGIDNYGTVEWSSFERAFKGCANLATSETNPDLSNVTDINRIFNFFSSSTVFNGNITGWNTSNVVDMTFVFTKAIAFNQNIGNWNTSNVTDMQRMFRDALSFSQDISAWNIEQVINMAGMFLSADMNILGTTTNYDNLLIKWSQQNVQLNVEFDAGNSKYNPSATLPGYQVNAGQARQILLNNGWTISDAGQI